jgi:hypothetical protein
MMKLLLIGLTISFSALAQMPSMSDLGGKSKELTAKVMAACKDDKSKVKGCESYTELSPLKTCLMKNKEALSPGFKESLSLVK